MKTINLNQQISILRKEKGLTQEELAVALGVTNQAVSKWESAQCCPDIQLLPQIAELFQVSVDRLLGCSPVSPAEIRLPSLCEKIDSLSQEEALAFVTGQLEKIDFDVVIAGPAFQAGRYGNACGIVCKAVQDKFGKPAITSMHEENPGVDLFRNDVIIMKGGKSAAAMKKDIAKMADYLNRKP